MWRGECDRTQEVIKLLLQTWVVGISNIPHLVECGPIDLDLDLFFVLRCV